MSTDRVQNVLYLADQTAADYIIDAKRLKSAEKRIAMWENRDQSMCLKEGCENPAAGKIIFAHCVNHLDHYESDWLEDGVETSGVIRFKERSGPFGKALYRAEESDAANIVTSKKAALDKAYGVVNAFWDVRKERRRLLPDALLRRLMEHEKRLFDVDMD